MRPRFVLPLLALTFTPTWAATAQSQAPSTPVPGTLGAPGGPVKPPSGPPTSKLAAGSGGAAQFVPREVLVDFRDAASAAARASARKAVDTVSTRKIGATGVEVLTLKRGASVQDAVAELDAKQAVALVAANGISYADTGTNDPLYPQQWALNNVGAPTIVGGTADADIDAPEAWDLNIGSSSVKIGILDTGVELTNPDIAPNLWANAAEVSGLAGVDDDNNGFIDDKNGWDFGEDDNDPSPVEPHGTGVAGVAAARGNNATGISGVAQRAAIVPLQVFSQASPGSPNYTVTDENIIDAIEYAASKQVDVLNASLSGTYDNPLVAAALEAAPNITFVTTAGNTGQNVDDNPRYPCAYDVPTIICVGSTDRTDVKATSSGYGPMNVDLSAPGAAVTTLWPASPTGFEVVGGTSFAAPAVAGAAAVLKSANPSWTPAQIKARLMGTVDRPAALAGLSRTEGRLNLDKALRNIASPARPAGSVSVVSGQLRVTAGAGASNDVAVSESTTAFVVADDFAPLTAGTGCSLASGVVSCAKSGITSLRIDLLDGANTASTSVALPLTYVGGTGPDRVTAGSGAANISTGDGSDRVQGGTANDTINTGNGDDWAYGGYGDDTIDAGDGNDIAAGDEGDDTLQLGAGDDQTVAAREDGEDVIYGGAGNDLIRGGAGVDQLLGQDDDDVIEASKGTDSLVDGGNGNDLLRSRPGTQTFVGGPGTDTVSYDFATSGTTIRLNGLPQSGTSGENDTLGTDIENVIGSPLADQIYGSSAANQLDGGNGADNVRGEDGNDVILAGSPDLANDTYDGGNGVDTVSYDPVDSFTNTGVAGVRVTLDGVADDGLVSLGESDNVSATIENVIGTDADDQITGSSAANVLTGAGGDDVLVGLGGTDTFDGGSGTDTVSYGDRSVAVSVSLDNVANDGVAGENENVGATIEKVVGGTAGDTLSSGRDGTTLEGGAGADAYTTTDGGQAILARDGVNDTIASCGNGTDTVAADTGDIVTSTTCETVNRAATAQITSGPTEAKPTNSATPSFPFSAPYSTGVTFKCRVGAGSGVPAGTGSACTSPWTTSTLTEGVHTVAVQAYVGGSPSGPVATRTFIVDLTAPGTDGGLYAPGDYPDARFKGFYVILAEAAFETDGGVSCRFGSAPLRRCNLRTPFITETDGEQTFEVAASDLAGNADPTPALMTVVNQNLPDTAIDSGPQGATYTTRPRFGLSSTDSDVIAYECRFVPVGGGTVPAFAPCSGATSHQASADLAEGQYRFEVRARDVFGGLDPTPAYAAIEVRTPRWGFVWNDSPTSASYTPAATKQGSSTGATNTIAHPATGDYTVTFPTLGTGLRGNAQVRATGTNGNRCVSFAFGASGSNATVRIKCATPAGVAADTPFVAAFQVNERVQSLDAGYATAMLPTEPAYVIDSWLSANSTDDSNSSTRFSAGTYLASFNSFAGNGVPVITAVGDPGVWCQSSSIGASMGVRCYNSASTLTDAKYSIAFADSSAFTNRRGAYIHADNATSTTPYSPSAANRKWNSQGAAPTSRKITQGQYEVILPGHAATNAIPLVTGYSSTVGRYCWAASWAASGSNTAVQVRCSAVGGAAADAQFTLSYASSTP